MRPPRLCILGYGKVARELHRPAWQQLAAEGRVQVALICEPAEQGARLAQAHFPMATVLRSPASEVLAASDCEIVDICTPGHTHAALVLEALATGAHVLVEKPPCHTTAELDAIIEATADRAVSVCQSWRFQPPCRQLSAAMARGRLGDVTRVQVTHHARHALNESEWVTRARPDGVLFENAVHFVDLVVIILEVTTALTIDAVRFYETSHRRVLTGFELMASDGAGRQVTIDFLQDTLVHSALQTRVFVSATGADAELRFSPPGFRLLSGIVDPVGDLAGDAQRLAQLGRGLIDPHRRARPHLILATDLLDAAATGRPTLAPPQSLRPTIVLLEELAHRWSAHPPTAGPGPTTAFMAPDARTPIVEK